MRESASSETRQVARRLAAAPGWILGALCLALHLAFNGGYGVFRDELYFIVCGLHPDFGYVDQPPLVPLIAAGIYKAFGASAFALRLPSALASAATVALTSAFAGALGGGLFARWLAGLAVLLAPVLLVDGLLLSTDLLQPLTWLGASWCLLRLAQSRDERWWLAFGAVVGVSLSSKYLIGFYLVGLAVGIVLTPLRRSLARPWIYAGAALALALVAPSLVWQAQHGWPFLELGRAGAAGKNIALSPLGFIGAQIMQFGPVSAPLWIAGLASLAWRPPHSELRAIAIAWAVAVALFVILHGKAYYLAPIAPMLFAAGAVFAERHIPRFGWRALVASVLTIGGLASLPLALPILSPENLARFQRAIGVGPGNSAGERGPQGALPQYFADMFGWREMAAAVAAVYRALPEAERAKAVFYGRNYGEAAALEIYGRSLDGPPAISAHNSFYIWGPRGFDGSVVIALGEPGARFAQNFAKVSVAGRVENAWAMPYETNVPILVLRGPRQPLDALWPSLKHFE